MKSRVNLTPELQRYVRESVAHQIKLEAGYVTASLVCLAALVLADEYGFGCRRLETYCEKLHDKVHEMVERYGDDWPDAAMSALRKKGVEILDDGWIAERQWYIDQSKPREPDPVVPMQLHGELERFRQALEAQGGDAVGKRHAPKIPVSEP